MEILIAVLVTLVISEAIVILQLRVKNKRLVLQNAVYLFNEAIGSMKKPGSDFDEEHVPELSEEENQQQAELVQKVHILCQLSKAHLDDLSDEYESKKLKERVDKAFAMAKEIDDPFYFGAALHPIINLVHQAGWDEMTKKLIKMVSDPFIKQWVIEDLNERNA